jgi:hypothetical protein
MLLHFSHPFLYLYLLPFSSSCRYLSSAIKFAEHLSEIPSDRIRFHGLNLQF